MTPLVSVARALGLTLLCSAIAVPRGRSQQPPLAVPDPAAIPGRWEASDGHGGFVGMNISMSASMDNAQSISGIHTQVYEGDFVAALYERHGSDVEQADLSFRAASYSGNTTWDGHRLYIPEIQRTDTQKESVNLIWQSETQTWKGLFERGDFREQVILKRPVTSERTSPFVGTWLDPSGTMNNCLHIAQQDDGVYMAWTDDIRFPGHTRYAKTIQPPPTFSEHYGEIARIEVKSPRLITVMTRPFTPMCCPHPFTATLSSDGQNLSGVWLPGGNQSSSPVAWKKLQGDACIKNDMPR